MKCHDMKNHGNKPVESALRPSKKKKSRFARPNSFASIEPLESRQLLSASISGALFNDLNANGMRNSGEPALAGVRVYADLGNRGCYKSGDPNAITSASGAYSIPGLSPGIYEVRQVLPAQFRQTLPGNGLSLRVSVPSSASHLSGYSFGDTQKVRVSGIVYNDASHDGARDNGEGVLAGATVYIDTNGDKKLDNHELSTTTNSFGYFVIGDLPAGSYAVRVQPQGAYAGYVQTQPAANGGYTVKLQKGQTGDNMLFGIAKPVISSSSVVLLSASRSVTDKGTLDDGLGHVENFGKTQTVSGFGPFNGDVQFSADTGSYQQGGTNNDISVSARAVLSSSLSTTQISATGESDASEYEIYLNNTSYAQSSVNFTVTFKVTKAVSYQLSAKIDPTSANGLGTPEGGAFAFTAASGASPVGQMYAYYQQPIDISKSGVLAPGTYTISESANAYDNGDIGPTVPFSLNLKFA